MFGAYVSVVGWLLVRIAAARGEEKGALAGYKTAAGLFRELSAPFWLAVTLLEHGEWLLTQERGGETEQMFAEACEIFERLQAAPWLQRAEAARARVGAQATS